MNRVEAILELDMWVMKGWIMQWIDQQEMRWVVDKSSLVQHGLEWQEQWAEDQSADIVLTDTPLLLVEW